MESMKKDRYIYPAFFCYYNDDSVGVVFPDLPGCVSQGGGEEDALRMAREALALHLWSMEDDGDEIPVPTLVRDLEPEDDQAIALIDVWMPAIREKMNNKAVTRAVTLPRWLDVSAKEAKLNYSQVLQDGLVKRLGIKKNQTSVRDKRKKVIA